MKRLKVIAASRLPVALLCSLLMAAQASPVRLEKVERSRLLDDVKTLASDAFAGRATDTPGNRRAQAFIAARFEQLKLNRFKNSYQQHFSFAEPKPEGAPAKRLNGTNLIGYIKGSQAAGQFLVVSAHYDHLGVKNGQIYHGADDNASGVAALLAAARYFSQHPPRHSVIFAAFDAEEKGLQGARAFFDNLPVAREALLADLNLDMVSRSEKGEIFISGTRHYPQFKPLVEALPAQPGVKVRFGHDEPGPVLPNKDDWTDQSDHFLFHQHQVPFLYLGVEDHPDYHQPTDTFERINPDFFVGVTGLVIDLIASLDAQPRLSFTLKAGDGYLFALNIEGRNFAALRDERLKFTKGIRRERGLLPPA